jgi:hypothetical protein
MRSTFLVLTLSVLFTGIYAQEVKDKVPTTYDRSSLTVLYLDFSSGNHWHTAKAKIDSVMFSDKYDNHNIDFLLFKPTFERGVITANMQEAILRELETAKINKKIISKWYNRKPDGSMDMELVHERGRFTATDADFLRAQTSKRGNAALEEFGNRLVNLSYVLVVDIADIKTMAEAGLKGQRGWQARVTGYLFKIDFTDEVRYAFYDTWIYDDDTESEKARKRNAFDELDFPMVFVTQKSIPVSASQPEGNSGLSLLFKPKTVDQLMQDLVQKSYDETIYRIEMEVEEFKVKTALHGVRPLRAKIGLKEGLKTDYRFFAYEHVYNPKTNKAEPKRRGVIRADSKSKIVDNRRVAAGDMETSQFYQVAGRKLEEGFTLQQQNDFGIEVALGPEIGEVGGFFVRADYRVGRYTGIKALLVYGELGIQTKSYTSFPYYTSSDLFAFLRYGLGVAKGFHLTRNIELRPYIGAGVESASNSDFTGEDAPSVLYVKPGVNLALNLKHNFQVVGGLGVYGFMGDGESESGINVGSWGNAFQNRGGASTFFGIKLGF